MAFGESPDSAAIRELAEETGLEGVVDSIVAIDSYVRSDAEVGETHAVSIVFSVQVVGGELRDEIGGSTERCAWLDPAEIAGLPVSRLVRTTLGFGLEIS